MQYNVTNNNINFSLRNVFKGGPGHAITLLSKRRAVVFWYSPILRSLRFRGNPPVFPSPLEFPPSQGGATARDSQTTRALSLSSPWRPR